MADDYETIANNLDLAEDIITGTERTYPIPAERYRAILAYADRLRRHSETEAAMRLQSHVQQTYRRECIAAGVCPECGEELQTEVVVEHHGANRLGSEPERLSRAVCPMCGEV